MELILLEILTVSLYLLAAGSQYMGLTRQLRHRHKDFLYGFAIPALLIHGFLLYLWIDLSNFSTSHAISFSNIFHHIGGGQNLYFFNILSLIGWLAALIITVSSISKPLETLAIFIFPITALTIVLVQLFPGEYLVDTAANPKHLLHILLSILAFSVLGIAAFQAVILYIQDSLLRNKQTRIARMLPSIETMESLLFEIIWLGFILLSIVLFSSLLFFYGVFAPTLTHSPYLALLAWFVFAMLLFGRHYFGWRGQAAIRWTLGGVVLLVLSYFGNWLLSGFIH